MRKEGTVRAAAAPVERSEFTSMQRARRLMNPLLYNLALISPTRRLQIMEADRINAIENKLNDLASRLRELRRYL
jgi:hypothetical protein